MITNILDSKIKKESPIYMNKTKGLSRYLEKSKNMSFKKKIIKCTIGIERIFSSNDE